MSVAHYFDTMDYGPAPEADGDARAWLEARGGTFGHYVDGRFTEGSKHFITFEPATGKALAKLAEGTPEEIAEAVAAARAAQPEWAALPGHMRARHLYALARMVQRHARLFAVLEALDNGKPVRETRDIDLPLVARHFSHHAGWAELSDSEFPDHRPLGVVGQIIPWNFPLLMLAWKVAPALALGNTVVLKPAEYTSLTALLFAELAGRVGLPAGVLNVVTGGGDTGGALVRAEVDKIAFTGSTEVGRAIRIATAGSGKALSLELGGKSPFIVFDDADLDGAVEGVVDAIWFNQGEVCCAGSRLLVQESIAEEFEKRLLTRMATMRLGDPLDKASDMGAIVDPAQKARIEAMVAEGREAGGTVHQASAPEGCYYPPTLITGLAPSATAATEEIFGPVAVSLTFRTPDEAVLLANHSRYGLAASVWSETIGQAMQVAGALNAGVVWVNTTNAFDAAVPFGGRRESGFGREGGLEGALEYLAFEPWADAPDRAKLTVPPADGTLTDPVDRTAKLYVGGKQVRPDGNYALPVVSLDGRQVGEAGEGNRKDIRNAVAAARAATGWAASSEHNRAQILYYIAENLSARAAEFAARIDTMTGGGAEEVETCIAVLFRHAALADKWDGATRRPPAGGLALALPEPQGVVGVICPPTQPLLGLVALMAPLIARGNCAVMVPSAPHPLAATDFYQVLETSDVPAGVVNIVTGDAAALAAVLADHGDVDALWAFGDAELCEQVEARSAHNLKRTLVDHGRDVPLTTPAAARHLQRHAADVKSIWIPYAE